MTERAPQSQDKFIIRLPDGMRDRIKAAAEANNRSMNAEIVAALEEKFPPPKPAQMKATQWLSMVEAILRQPSMTGGPEAREILLQVRDLLVEAIQIDPDAMFPEALDEALDKSDP